MRRRNIQKRVKLIGFKEEGGGVEYWIFCHEGMHYSLRIINGKFQMWFPYSHMNDAKSCVYQNIFIPEYVKVALAKVESKKINSFDIDRHNRIFKRISKWKNEKFEFGGD